MKKNVRSQQDSVNLHRKYVDALRAGGFVCFLRMSSTQRGEDLRFVWRDFQLAFASLDCGAVNGSQLQQ